MKRLIALIIIMLALVNFLPASGQIAKTKNTKQEWATIRLKSEHLKSSDTLVLTTYGNYIYGELNSQRTIATQDGTGIYTFRIPIRNVPQRFSIDGAGLRENSALLSYYAEPGDNITITGSREAGGDWQMSFSGTGAAKYQSIYSADTAIAKLARRLGSRIIRSPMQRNFGRSDSLSAYGLSFINGRSRGMIPEIATLIKARVIGKLYERGVLFLSPRLSPKATAAELNYLKRQYDELAARPIDTVNVITAQSPEYIKLLFERLRTGATFAVYPSNPSLKALYDQIAASFKGPYFDRLTTHLLMGYKPDANSTTGDYLDCIRIALSKLKDTIAQGYLRRQLAAYSKGIDSFSFALPDTAGKIHRLVDFKGKVVLMDFWFTGCGPCLQFAELLHRDIIPIYKDDPRIVFVNINADRDAGKWKESVSGGRYTPPGSISLFTEGKAFDHPLIRHYNFTGFPQVVLLDGNGKVYSALVPHDRKGLLALLQEALAEGSISKGKR
ncbi:thioredoxin family protein [Pedobacter sp. KR3-3]|uniref:Thioredoxin family protein n=1 Tax=Pedobacter albus TaxID=3113905 RepID=A0ABU7IAB1_9SPHI|nr:thioredoxin family protein [Pedobacter sp. KR3-3]MEE1946428.1 thioredoxin family protein [Pedobacter sp. KR3-3]